jgi:uncharacterized membrane protein
MAILAGALAVLLGVIWPASQEQIPSISWLDRMSSSNASLILSTLAGSTITIAGAIFSITIVSLNMTSAQFGPGLIEKFLRAGATQITMGTFLACFVFCLLMLTLLPDVESREDRRAVMQLAVACGVSLGILSFVVLIYFIQSTSRLLQARYIVFSLAEDALRIVRRVFKPETGDCSELGEQCEHPIAIEKSGYIQTIDKASVAAAAAETDNLVRLDVNVGEYLLSGQVVGAMREVDEALGDAVQAALRTGVERTPAEDPQFAMERITEVAVRCLSPGINDPFTALACIDQLGRIINELRHYSEPGTCFRDESENVRLVMPPVLFEKLVRTAFDPICMNIGEQSQVRERLVALLTDLSNNTQQPCLLAGLNLQLETIRQAQALDR